MLNINGVKKITADTAGEVRVWNYSAGQVNYYKVNKTALFIVVKILKLFGLVR